MTSKSDIKNRCTNTYLRLDSKFKQILSKPAKIVELTQAHFQNGTIQIGPDYYVWTNPGSGLTEKIVESTHNFVFRLVEDISFNPNSVATLGVPNDTNGNPDSYATGDILPAQLVSNGGHYDDMAYGLHFFAAIAIHAHNIVFDLNQHTIQESAEHALQQRFFAVIETANMPFLPNQGPHTFGKKLLAAEGLAILNGKIGLSSHHGIHGNDNRDVLLQDLTFENYEVASFSFNGGRDFAVRNCHATGNRSDLPVLGTWSAARFIRPYINKLVADSSPITLSVGGVPKSVTDIRNELRLAMNAVYKELIVDGATKTTNLVFDNHLHRIDGNSYGFLFNRRGVAIGGFPASKDNVFQNIYLNNVTVQDHFGYVNEIPALRNGTNDQHQMDPVGSVFQTQNRDHNDALLTINSSGVYTGNVVANAQAIVAKAILNAHNFGSLSVARNRINQDTLTWIETQQTISGAGLTYIFNGDSMHHANKGVIGFKLDSCEYLYAVDCSVDGIHNTTPHIGLTKEKLVDYTDNSDAYKNYKNRKAIVTSTGETTPGNNGLACRGVSMASSNMCYLQNCSVRNVNSHYGPAIGVDVHKLSSIVYLDNVNVYGIHAGTAGDIDEWNNNPTQRPIAVGVRGEKDVTSLSMESIDCQEVTSIDIAYKNLIEN